MPMDWPRLFKIQKHAEHGDACHHQPHLCGDPDCPGPKLVARLEAAEAMALAARQYRDFYAEGQPLLDGSMAHQLLFALAAYEAAK
jgi:hypothetical protein